MRLVARISHLLRGSSNPAGQRLDHGSNRRRGSSSAPWGKGRRICVVIASRRIRHAPPLRSKICRSVTEPSAARPARPRTTARPAGREGCARPGAGSPGAWAGVDLRWLAVTSSASRAPVALGTSALRLLRLPVSGTGLGQGLRRCCCSWFAGGCGCSEGCGASSAAGVPCCSASWSGVGKAAAARRAAEVRSCWWTSVWTRRPS
jgi:hypothetical protein